MMRSLVILLVMLVAAMARGAEPAKPILIEKPDAFPTLVNPRCSHCIDESKRRADDLKADDRVLCWIRGYSDGGAIPFRFFLHPYRVISDSYGVFVLDPDAGFARGFAPSFQFRFHGWRNGIMVMKHKDGSLYSALSGVAFDGPKKGTRLPPVPTLVGDWGDWLKTYPQAVAYHMFEKYKPVELPAEIHADSQKSRLPADKRLPADTLVLGVWDGKQARAYPLSAIEKAGFVEETVDGRARVIFWHGASKTAAAYVAVAAPPGKYTAPKPNDDGESPPEKAPDKTRAVTLLLDKKGYLDKETNSRWDVAGRAVDGELKGWTLSWLDGVVVRWFAWAAEYPETTIYGK